MNSAEAAAQLQTIRTLMERAALYRRALGPTFIGTGSLGVLATIAALAQAYPPNGLSFVGYWSVVAALALIGTALRVRQQALRAAEPLWTPPTRRVVSALAPPILVAVVVTVSGVLLGLGSHSIWAFVLPALWLVMYGLALHAAGHFTLRGIRWLGWAFVIAGLIFPVVCAHYAPVMDSRSAWRAANLIMGLTFGLGHLIAGARLLALERRLPA